MGRVVITPTRRGGQRGGRGRYQPVVELINDVNNNGREAMQEVAVGGDREEGDINAAAGDIDAAAAAPLHPAPAASYSPHGREQEEEEQEEEEQQEQEGIEDQGQGNREEQRLLRVGTRRIRGVEEEQVELADRLDPEVPGPVPGPLQADGDGWTEIDRLGAWDCALNLFYSMDDIPDPLRVRWGKAVSKVLQAVLSASSQEAMDRALKWFLILPAALLRQAKRGGQNGRGRAEVAARFTAVSEDNWGALITYLVADKRREEERRRREGQRAARPERSEADTVKLKRKAALTCLAKGQISKAVSRLTSHGVADTKDPAVMEALRSKYVERGRDLPASVTRGQPVDNVSGLKDALLALGTGTSPGTGGMRGEFLTCLAEVWDEEEMSRLEDFSMLYLTGALPPWWYKVWGSVTTVPLYKTRERESLRPVGVMNPLIRTLHSLLIKEMMTGISVAR